MDQQLPQVGPPARAAAGPPGSTLIELIVVLALMALLLGLVPAALFAPRPEGSSDRALVAARAAAIRTGRRVTAVDSAGHPMLFLPDGRTLGVGPKAPDGGESSDAR